MEAVDKLNCGANKRSGAGKAEKETPRKQDPGFKDPTDEVSRKAFLDAERQAKACVANEIGCPKGCDLLVGPATSYPSSIVVVRPASSGRALIWTATVTWAVAWTCVPALATTVEFHEPDAAPAPPPEPPPEPPPGASPK